MANSNPKATPDSPQDEVKPRREWTDMTVEEERRVLELQLDEARTRHDEGEVRRIEARLRLLNGAESPSPSRAPG